MSFSFLRTVSFATCLFIVGCSMPSHKENTALLEGQAYETEVGKHVVSMQGAFVLSQTNFPKFEETYAHLKNVISQDSKKYVEKQVFVLSRLQRGTTRSNPILVQRLKELKDELALIERNVALFGKLTKAIQVDLNKIKDLKKAIQSAYLVEGAVDEDHDALRELEKSVGEFEVQEALFLGKVEEGIAPQEAYISLEKRNLDLLSQAIHYGRLDAKRKIEIKALPFLEEIPKKSVQKEHQKPLMVIDFENSDPRYEGALMKVVKTVLAKKPKAQFQVLTRSVLQSKSPRIRKETAFIFKLMTSLGVSSSHIKFSSETDGRLKADEILIFVK
ncbi:MAG: hypothetical protein PHI50_05230 [Alphaproteobacteria bacterium]|nr:hypothetical protein [Alphaproteobacteria bacterium]